MEISGLQKRLKNKILLVGYSDGTSESRVDYVVDYVYMLGSFY